MTDVAQQLRALIDKSGLSREGFARRAGLSNGTLYALLAGGPVGSLPTARKLRAIGVRLPRELLSA